MIICINICNKNFCLKREITQATHCLLEEAEPVSCESLAKIIALLISSLKSLRRAAS